MDSLNLYNYSLNGERIAVTFCALIFGERPCLCLISTLLMHLETYVRKINCES